MQQENKVFHLGIAMAGAVSAGAYTAGVMDYLLETLQRWQEAKDKNRELGEDHPEYDPSIPMHDVVIDVMGGSSAGGMTAAITALALFEGVNLKEWDPNKKKLYDSWVNLNDHPSKGKTLEQLLDTVDIKKAEELPSLLNSKAIDEIADRARDLECTTDLPPYISREMEIILTITSLRGIPIDVNFFDPRKEIAKAEENGRKARLPAHKMYLHKGVAHFQFDLEGKNTPAHTIPFNPDNELSKSTLLETAKATGAFPIGLQARKLRGINLDYIKSMAYRMFELKPPAEGMEHAGIEINSKSDPFDLVAVDGGTVNNEPFGEIIRVLEEKFGSEGENHAVIMIDPFPNFDTAEQEEIFHPGNVIEIIPSLLGAIRAQAMMKEKEIVKGLSTDHTRKMIFPKKENEHYPIACGSLDGFGGFFSREFREHDYLLGRRNCQRFLRKHLSIHINKAKKHPLFSDWESDGSDARHNRFFVKHNETGEEGAYPIIPDLGIEAMSRELFYDPYEKEPPKPSIDPKEIIDLYPKIQNRIRSILLHILKTNRETIDHFEPETRDFVNQIMDDHFKKPGFLSRSANNLVMKIWRGKGSKSVAKNLSQKVIQQILLDFKKRGLLK